MTLTNTDPAAVAKRALDTYRELLASGHTDGYARAVSIGTVVVEADRAKNDRTADAIALICTTYASHYKNSGNELRALAATQQELAESVGFEVAGVQRPLNRETYEHPHGGFTGRSTLPRWLLELDGDSSEDKST